MLSRVLHDEMTKNKKSTVLSPLRTSRVIGGNLYGGVLGLHMVLYMVTKEYEEALDQTNLANATRASSN